MVAKCSCLCHCHKCVQGTVKKSARPVCFEEMFRCGSKSTLTASEFSIFSVVESKRLMANQFLPHLQMATFCGVGNQYINTGACITGEKEILQDANFLNI